MFSFLKAGYKVGDKVWSMTDGFGKIVEIYTESTYPIFVLYKNREATYTEFGVNKKRDINPTLFTDKFEIPDGINEISEEVIANFTPVWCWGNSESENFSRSVRFYDSSKKMVYGIKGESFGIPFSNYEIVANPTAWMLKKKRELMEKYSLDKS